MAEHEIIYSDLIRYAKRIEKADVNIFVEKYGKYFGLENTWAKVESVAINPYMSAILKNGLLVIDNNTIKTVEDIKKILSADLDYLDQLSPSFFVGTNADVLVDICQDILGQMNSEEINGRKVYSEGEIKTMVLRIESIFMQKRAAFNYDCLSTNKSDENIGKLSDLRYSKIDKQEDREF